MSVKCIYKSFPLLNCNEIRPCLKSDPSSSKIAHTIPSWTLRKSAKYADKYSKHPHWRVPSSTSILMSHCCAQSQKMWRQCHSFRCFLWRWDPVSKQALLQLQTEQFAVSDAQGCTASLAQIRCQHGLGAVPRPRAATEFPHIVIGCTYAEGGKYILILPSGDCSPLAKLLQYASGVHYINI